MLDASTEQNWPTDIWTPHEVVTIVLCSVIVPFILVGNVLVILAVKRFKRLQIPTNYFLVALALTDICIGLLIPFSVATEVHKIRIYDIVLCLTPHCVMVTAAGASILCLSAIAVDRHTAISRSLKYRHIISVKKILIFSVISWIYSALIAWSPLMGWHEEIHVPESMCSYKLIMDEALILLLSALFLPAYLVIFFCYFKIYLVAKHHAHSIAAMEYSVYQSLQIHFLKKDTKYAKTLAIVIGFFLLLWLPYQICILVEVVSKVDVPEWVRNYLALLAYCNSGINPWVYAYRNQDFNSAFKQQYKDCVKWCRSKCRHKHSPEDNSNTQGSNGDVRLPLDNARMQTCYLNDTLCQDAPPDVDCSHKKSASDDEGSEMMLYSLPKPSNQTITYPVTDLPSTENIPPIQT